MRLCRSVRGACLVLALFGAAPVHGQLAAEHGRPHIVDIAAHVAEAAKRFGLPEQWIYAVIRTESAGRIGAVSSAGAMGLMQLMPGTWVRQRRRFGLGGDPFDPRDNILAGTSYLREMYDRYGHSGFLAAYNAGPGRYEDWRDRGRPLPAETRAYVAKIAPMLQSANATAVVASASSPQPVHLSWEHGQLFAKRSSDTDDASAAPATEADQPGVLVPARPHNGIFAPISGTRSQ